MNLQEAFELFKQDKQLMRYSQHTLKAYGIQLNLLTKYLGNIAINEVTTVQLKQYILDQNHLKISSLGHRIRFIRSFFRWLYDEGLISINPARKIKEPKDKDRIPKALTEEEMGTITRTLYKCFGTRHSRIFVFNRLSYWRSNTFKLY